MQLATDKPRIQDIINAYRAVNKLEKEYKEETISTGEFHKQIEEPNNVLRHNRLYLRNVKPGNYNYKNFEKLINEITMSGRKHFSMSVFFGALNSEKSIYHYGSDGKFSRETSSFNCNSIACIAGYASALAVDWDEKMTLFSNECTNAEHWEDIACNWLNIPLQVGEKIFYGNDGSVWSYLKTRVSYFESLDWELDSQSALEYGECDEDDYTNLTIDLSSVSYKQAAEMLRMIKDNELIFDDDFEPVLIRKNSK